MKILSIILMALGVAISAAYASKLSPELKEQITQKQKNMLAEKKETKAVEPIGPKVRLNSWRHENQFPFAIGIVFIFVGSILGRRAFKEDSGNEDDAATAIDFGAVLSRSQENVDEILALINDCKSYDEKIASQALTKIESLQAHDIEILVDARQRLKMRYGIHHFTEIMSPLSRAERKINRAWSTLVDQHFPETKNSLKIAKSGLATASEKLEVAIASLHSA